MAFWAWTRGLSWALWPGVVGLVLGLAPRAQAQTAQEFASWTAASVRADLGSASEGPSLWYDTQVRSRSTGVQVLFRPGVAWRFNTWGSMWAGYLYTPTFPAGQGPALHEHRAWEQLQASFAFERARIAWRARVEERFRSDGADVGGWVRPRLELDLRLGADASVWAVLHDELFVAFNDTDWGQRAGFDQNRAFAGLRVGAGSGVHVDVGYMNQLLNREPDAMHHVLWVSVGAVVPP
ncbi:MAG: DUF2490 domain-containing protein [Myxococcota bacterium]